MTNNENTNPIEHLIHSTIRIECETPHGISSGTGYFYAFLKEKEHHIPCIVTNKHVIKDATKGTFFLSKQNNNGEVEIGSHIPISIDGFESRWIGHPDKDIDLAILPIAQIIKQANQDNITFYYRSLHKELLAHDELLKSLSTMEDIIMIGYPNGIWDEKHNLPIIRKGITATHPKTPYNGKPEFMIDAACFPGSSGSPVFLANIGSYVSKDGNLCVGSRISLLGTLYAGPQHTVTGDVCIINIPTVNKPISRSTIPNNLGLVIQASKLNDFDEILKEMLKKGESE
ncbi:MULTISPECIES: S1 family peptidase [Francisella]|uniref:S1 family peptidase n=1 Tax=Francisella TaxID=262 RepID=UPI0011B609EF|nr:MULTISPECIES: serine protease [Francisella]